MFLHIFLYDSNYYLSAYFQLEFCLLSDWNIYVKKESNEPKVEAIKVRISMTFHDFLLIRTGFRCKVISLASTKSPSIEEFNLELISRTNVSCNASLVVKDIWNRLRTPERSCYAKFEWIITGPISSFSWGLMAAATHYRGGLDRSFA